MWGNMLPMKYWISILLTLWIYIDLGGGTEDKGSKSQASCRIASPFDSPFVKAHLMTYTPGRGCTFNVTTPRRQEVHVLNVKVNEKESPEEKWTQVNLRVEPKSFMDPEITEEYQRPLVFVLYSTVPVKWKVELIGISATRIKHQFLVPRHSRIRIKKSILKKHVKGRSMKMPEVTSPSELIGWTEKRFKVVTSYSELEGRDLLFRVGLGTGEKCNLTDLQASPNAAISNIHIQPTDGCVSEGKKILLARPVYIIELLDDPPDLFGKKDKKMELEVTSINNEPINKDFYLILKSPASLQWSIRSRKVQGWIDIVTDAVIDLKGIRMHTVALRRESMKDTGADLIDWAEYYIAPVEAYTRIQKANRIQLLLSPNVKRVNSNQPNFVDPRGIVTDPLEPTDVTDHLKQMIHTQCNHGIMEIAIASDLLKGIGLIKEQITLRDPLCRAKMNNTHIILKTPLDKCHTKSLMLGDENVFSNAIVIRSSGVTDALIEEFGSAYLDTSEISGSGSHDLVENTYLDDEDFASHSAHIDVNCHVPAGHVIIEPFGRSQGVTYELQLYKDSSFQQSHVLAPITLARNSRLFVQASITSDSHLGVDILNCWVTPAPTYRDKDASRIAIIRNGCAEEQSINLEWHYSPNSISTSTQSVSRFSFVLHDFFRNSRQTYLHCEVSVCRKDSFTKGSGIPKCMDDQQSGCEEAPLNRRADEARRIGAKILVTGPWTVIDYEFTVSGGSVTANTPNQSGSNKVTIAGSTEPQHSVIIEGLDSATVVGIAFAAFAIGILLTGALWFIHTHTGPGKRGISSQGSAETSGESTPNSSSPISA